jgi:hypothetical protein
MGGKLTPTAGLGKVFTVLEETVYHVKNWVVSIARTVQFRVFK